jgi:hypothetical protein
MSDIEGFSLSPINFFQINVDCHKLKGGFPSLAKAKDSRYALPDTSALNGDDSFATLFMGWSVDGIEAHVVVEEPFSVSSYPDVSKGDSIELFFDTRNVKTSGFNTKFCHHFFFFPEAIEGHRAGEITKFRSEDSHELADPADLVVKTKKSAKGYSLEIFIPAACLHGFDPEQFDKLGFTYRINRAGGEPQHFSVISAEYQLEQQPSLWSTLNLVP